MNRTILLIFILCVPRIAYAKRPPPPEVPPIKLNGVQYSLSDGPAGGDNPNVAIYVDAVDLKMANLLWKTKLYEIKDNPHVEEDVQDIFVTSMRAIGGQLHLVNEKGDTFKVDLSTGKLLEGGGRVYYFSDHEVDESPLRYVTALVGSVAALMILYVLLSWYYRTWRTDGHSS